MFPNDLICGQVGEAHCNPWKSHFGAGRGSSLAVDAALSVSEPTGRPLAASGVVAVLLSARRRFASLAFAVALSASLPTGAANAVPDLSPCGDYNDNGTCDAADYVMWREHLGKTFVLPNDNSPGTVDQDDYDHWRSGFGYSFGGSSAILLPEVSTVPAEAAVAGCPGDYNNDGNCTDAADYVMWRNSVGMPRGTLPNDSTVGVDGNPIGPAQYKLWRENFGILTGVGALNSSSIVGTVPEPSTALLAALGALATLSFAARRRTQRST